MGLLVGQIINSEAHIHRSLVLSRRDKQKDRVEVGYEHLAVASTIAERLTNAEGSQQNVIGWYHSHPHITVMPSHVDVKTQGCMQMLDSNFVGLIFSVFDMGSGDVNVCAFQSQGTGASVDECSWSRVEIQIIVSHLMSPTPTLLGENAPMHKKESLVSLQQTLLGEAQSTFEEALSGANPITGEGFKSSSSHCSELELCRLTSVYHLNLLRIMDVQLLPTLHGLQSHRRSLEEEKQSLLQQLNLGNDVDSTITGVATEIHSSAEVLNVLDSTQSHWTRGVKAVQVASLGSNDVLAKCISLPCFADTRNVRYNIRIVRSLHSRTSMLPGGGTPVISGGGFGFDALNSECAVSWESMTPWSVEFSPMSGKDSVKFPLFDVQEGDFSQQVVVVVADSSGQSEKHSHAISLDFTDSGDITEPPETSVVNYWRQDLARALRLHAVAGPVLNDINTNVRTAADSGVVDISLSLTQTQ